MGDLLPIKLSKAIAVAPQASKALDVLRPELKRLIVKKVRRAATGGLDSLKKMSAGAIVFSGMPTGPIMYGVAPICGALVVVRLLQENVSIVGAAVVDWRTRLKGRGRSAVICVDAFANDNVILLMGTTLTNGDAVRLEARVVFGAQRLERHLDLALAS